MRNFSILQVLLRLALFISFSFSIYHLVGFSTRFDNLGYKEPSFKFNEEFDPSLQRLNTMSKLISYCDSLHANMGDIRDSLKNKDIYPEIISSTIRKRFYHGYSLYGLKNNYLGAIIAECSMKGLRAIVIPDDILKFPYAACSQQSIVGMEVFKKKGYSVRKVSMFDTISNSGHFAYEVYFENGWHFFDTNQEPDVRELNKYNRPSAAYLAENPFIVLEAYKSKADPEFFKRLVMSYKTDPPNKFPAPNAYLYQVVTKYLSYFGWLFILSILILSYGRKTRKTKNQLGMNIREQKNTGKAAFSHS